MATTIFFFTNKSTRRGKLHNSIYVAGEEDRRTIFEKHLNQNDAVNNVTSHKKISSDIEELHVQTGVEENKFDKKIKERGLNR